MKGLCATHPYDPALWDFMVHGETYRQRQGRLTVAVDVCRRCPLRLPCAAAAKPGREEGVWGGQLLPGLRLQAPARAA